MDMLWSFFMVSPLLSENPFPLIGSKGWGKHVENSKPATKHHEPGQEFVMSDGRRHCTHVVLRFLGLGKSDCTAIMFVDFLVFQLFRVYYFSFKWSRKMFLVRNVFIYIFPLYNSSGSASLSSFRPFLASFPLSSFPPFLLSYPFLSFPILSYPFLSFPILSYPFLSFPILSYPFLSFPILSYPFLSFPILSYPFLSFPILSYPFLSFPILSYPFLSFPFLFFPILSYPFLSFPILSYPFLLSSLFALSAGY